MNQTLKSGVNSQDAFTTNPNIKPSMAPMADIVEFDNETQAINYSIDLVLNEQRGLTQMQIADQMKVARAVLSKLRQEQVGMPLGKLPLFLKATRSYALLQFHALCAGLVLKTREDEATMQLRLETLTRENEHLQELNRRLTGEQQSANDTYSIQISPMDAWQSQRQSSGTRMPHQ